MTADGGLAVLAFEIPADHPAEEVRLQVEAKRGVVSRTAAESVEIFRDPDLRLYTDKGLYQPGQTLHMRALVFDNSHRAMQRANGTFHVIGPDEQVAFKLPVSTSRYGVASADFPIPASLRLGDYTVEFRLEDPLGSGSSTYERVRISRYDLPEFAMTVKPDKDFYLPGQDAVVSVEAAYIFGQPVTTGRVRVVSEQDGRWSDELNKWVTVPGRVFEGELGENGSCAIQVDLGEWHESLGAKRPGGYRDLEYAVTVTDESTGRTVERPIDLRISREAVHLYPIDLPWEVPAGRPFDFIVASFAADGTPISMEVEVYQARAADCSDDIEEQHFVRTVRTNRYGLAKVRGLVIPSTTTNRIVLETRDHTGRTAGRAFERISLTAEPMILLETDRTILRRGEPVTVRVRSGIPDTVVQVVKNLEVLRTQMVRLREGLAEVTFPWDSAFDGALSVVAYMPGSHGSWLDSGAVPAVYPTGKQASLDLRLNRTEMRPGQEARASFSLRDESKESMPGVLGVVAVDRALLEREEEEHLYRSAAWEESYAGLTATDILTLDTRKPVPAEMDLVAEVIFQYSDPLQRLARKGFPADAASDYSPLIQATLTPWRTAVKKALGAWPWDEYEAYEALREAGADTVGILDPWGSEYSLTFEPRGNRLILTLMTAGPDQVFQTNDDFVALEEGWYYFEKPGRTIDQAVEQFHRRTGGFIRDAQALASELSRLGMDLTKLLDPWGSPYELTFEISRGHYTVRVRSRGPDRVASDSGGDCTDDVHVWTASIDPFSDTRAAIAQALDSAVADGVAVPTNAEELECVLMRAGLSLGGLRDPWDRPITVSFSEESHYGDGVSVYAYSKYPDQPERKVEIRPVTRRIGWIRFVSRGPDGRPGTRDDYDAASFSAVLSEQAIAGSRRSAERPAIHASGFGSIAGTVRDEDGRPVSAVNVSAVRDGWVIRRTTTGVGGEYDLSGLAPGSYEVCLERAGYTTAITGDVSVRASETIVLNVTLTSMEAWEVITVQAESLQIDTKMTGVASIRKDDTATARQPIMTPRVRRYFPETLLWVPSLETDEEGEAEVRFTLADNTTTWRLSATGSTADGRIVSVDRDIRATMPFFIDCDPPRTLTVGDEISLPVILRSSMTRRVNVDLEMAPAPWLERITPRVADVDVLAEASRRESLKFRVHESVRDAPMRITAAGSSVGDAIEKPVSVIPDGEEVVRTESSMVGSSTRLRAAVPEDAIPGSLQGELIIYPDVLALVADTAERLLDRPNGCAEQTVSTAFAALLLLESTTPEEAHSAVLQRASRIVQQGYDRLGAFQQSGGGFSYWRDGTPDVALTAHVIRFLNRVRRHVAVDEKIVQRALDWLLAAQAADGRWPVDIGNVEDRNRTLAQTAMISRALAESSVRSGESPVRERLSRALGYLRSRLVEIQEPYALASYCMAALAADERPAAAQAAQRLQALAHDEAGSAYWSLETNTPFYGWGMAGRIETTALVVQALAAARRDQMEVDAGLIEKGVIFLFRKRDGLGAWGSTQATVNALEALLTQLAGPADGNRTGSEGAQIEIVVNGKRDSVLDLAAAEKSGGVIRADITHALRTGENVVEISGVDSPVMQACLAQVVLRSYRPWSKRESDGQDQERTPLALDVTYDATDTETGSVVNCRVRAERIGFRGYGMLIAEIGLPPGAEVDRRSIEDARKLAGFGLGMYEILPDRVVLYLWPRAGGIDLTFKFRPRYALKAKSACSVLYDYYNPDARVVVPPVVFNVREGG